MVLPIATVHILSGPPQLPTLVPTGTGFRVPEKQLDTSIMTLGKSMKSLLHGKDRIDTSPGHAESIPGGGTLRQLGCFSQ